MKNTVATLLIGAVAAMGVMTGCSNGQGTAAKLTTPKDSAAYYLGMAQTLPMQEQWEQFEYQVPGDSANKQDQFIKGFRAALTDKSDKAAYAQGYIMGYQVISSWEPFSERMPGEPLDKDTFIAGLIAGLSGKTDSTVNTQTINAYVQQYFENQQKIIEEQNKKAGADFLAENKTKEGVVELPSGLQYRIDELGTGVKPAAEDTVVVHYKGTKLDGTVFDSSYDRGEPATFPLTGVIKGFSEGLQQVPAGSKVTLWIPGDLAYGARGAGEDIGPFEMLTFEMELQEVRPAKK